MTMKVILKMYVPFVSKVSTKINKLFFKCLFANIFTTKIAFMSGLIKVYFVLFVGQILEKILKKWYNNRINLYLIDNTGYNSYIL